MDLLLPLLAVPALLALSAFFVVAEFALVALRSAQIEAIRPAHPKMAAILLYLKEHMNGAIATNQVGITMTNLALGSLGEPAMTEALVHVFSLGSNLKQAAWFHGLSTTISFVLVTFLTVVLAEQVPKALALQYATRCAMVVGRPVLFLYRLCMPLVLLMNWATNLVTRAIGLGVVNIEEEAASKDELVHITSEAAESGNLSSRERQLVLNSLALSRRTAAEIMVPRVRASFLDLRLTMEENQRRIGEYLYSRMPLCDGGMDNVVGVVYTKEFLTASQETDDPTVLLLIARPPVFVPVTITLDRLIQRFHDDKSHLVFLVDEHGGVQGVVTLTDVVDEIVGHMSEEGEDDRILKKMNDGWIVSGDMPINQLADMLNEPTWGQSEGVRSVGGLLMARLGRLPRLGDRVNIDGVQLLVHKTLGRSVDEVRVVLPTLNAAQPNVA